MKFLFTFFSFLSLFSFILANPVPQGQGSASNQEPRTCKITADGARHRKCPEVNDTKCPATGSYAKGTMIKFMCYVVGETVKGNPYAILTLLFSSHEPSVLIRYTPLIDTGTKLVRVNMFPRRLLRNHADVSSNCLYVSLVGGRVLNMVDSETP